MQKTKMVFTLGPSSSDENTIKNFIEIGMNAARINFSHGTMQENVDKIHLVKQTSKTLNKPVAVMMDIKGPKIRIHTIKNDKVFIKQSQNFTFSCSGEIVGDENKCSISFEDLYKDIKVDDMILVDDGLLEFRVTSIDGKNINCTALNSGYISSHKGVNVPTTSLNIPVITPKDEEDLVAGCSEQVDIVCASFIRSANDIKSIRNLLNKHNGNKIKIIAKIETREGTKNIDEIIDVSDGIMIARGDMGVQMPIEDLPAIQKSIIKKCNLKGKPVITATQMLDSMINNPRPTRAEVSDICNAILDGTDGIMLSGESANGEYPIEAAKMMSKIAVETEESFDFTEELNKRYEPHIENIETAVSLAACSCSVKLNADAIIALSRSGFTAKMISKYRPNCNIIAAVPDEIIMHSLCINFGVTGIVCDNFTSSDILTKEAIKKCLDLNYIKKGARVIIVSGLSSNKTGTTNMITVQTI
ncbi:MAG: pyruvate kinase [Clostridium sp.]|nr:pyruvate kinase [Clostridium sp.]